MTPRVRKALEASIKHWERNVTGKTSTIGSKNCALCRLFITKDCVGCPVRNRTGKPFCDGSPYPIANKMGNQYGYDSLRFRQAALRELRFLESLRP